MTLGPKHAPRRAMQPLPHPSPDHGQCCLTKQKRPVLHLVNFDVFAFVIIVTRVTDVTKSLPLHIHFNGKSGIA